MAFTKVVGPGIHTLSNILSHNINSSGIITATKFVGPFDSATIGGGTTISSDGINVTGIVTATQLDINGNGDISGNLVIGGNLTANGDFTTLNTTLREVELLRVDANSSVSAGIITQTGSGHGLVLADDTTFKMAMNVGSGIATFRALNAGYGNHNNASGIFQQIDLNTAAVTFGNTISVGGATITTGNGSHRIRSAANDFAIESTSSSYKGFRFLGNVPANTLVVSNTNSGSVGIGSEIPTAKLDVNGDVKVGSGITFHATNSRISLPDGTTGSPFTGNFEIGNGRDFTIVHDSNHTYMTNRTGNFYIGISDSVFPIQLKSNNTAEIYHGSTKVLNTISTGAQIDTILKLNGAAGNPGKLLLQEGGAISEIRVERSTDTSSALLFGTEISGTTATRWKIDTSGHFIPSAVGSYNIGSTGAEIGNVYIADSKNVYFGSDQDAEIYHNGSSLYMNNSTGNTYIRSGGGQILMRPSSSYDAIVAKTNEVELYYNQQNHSTPKLTTSATGITVDGEVSATQDYPLTKPVLDFNFAAEKKLDPRFQFTRESIATFIDKKGIVRYSSENQPRFDHHPTSGVSLGLLLEREQTNYQEYSTLMSEANGKTNITVTDNFAISPDGTQNASKIVNSTSNNTSTTLSWNGSTVANNSYGMWSIWVKSEETSCILQFFTNTYLAGASRMNIELADGTTGGDILSSTWRWNVEKYPNKWWRVSWGGNGANAAGSMLISVVDSKTAARGATCGSATNKTWFAWGVQEEIGTLSRIATSYIPTNGAAVLRKGDRATIDGDDFDDFFDRFQGTVINEHSNALQSIEGGGSGWEFNNDQLQVNLIAQTGSGYAHSHYPGCQASVFGDRNSGGSGGSGSPGTDYIQLYGPNNTIVNGGIQNGAANSGYGRYPGNLGGNPDYTRYYRTWTDAMSYDLTPSTNILRTATGGETTEGTNTQSISLANVSKFELGSDATDLLYSNYFGRIKRWVYYDKVLPLSQLATLTSQLPQSYL